VELAPPTGSPVHLDPLQNISSIGKVRYHPFGFDLIPGKRIMNKILASEFRSFLLYWGPIVLKDTIPKNYYQHFLLLSVAIRILLSPSITSSMLDLASKCLDKFLNLMLPLYGILLSPPPLPSLFLLYVALSLADPNVQVSDGVPLLCIL